MVKERKVKGEWSVCNSLFYLPKILLKNLSQIGIIDEKIFVHIDVSTIDNKKAEKNSRLSDDIEMTSDVQRQFGDFETAYFPLHNNQLAYMREVKILKFGCFSIAGRVFFSRALFYKLFNHECWRGAWIN